MAEQQKNWEDVIKEKFEEIKDQFNNPLLKHNLPKERKHEIENQLEQIAHKLSDNTLKIAVIGEFSAGKSTFLNALLRENDLIKSGKRPMTTAVTYIKHGPNDIFIEMKGERSDLRYSERVNEVKVDDSFKAFLSEYQANDDVASQVDRITLTLDRDILDNEAVIMDTPGFNAGNEEHQRVIEAVLKNEADAFVALFSALNAGRNSDLDFISEFGGHIKKFFFVLNKADISDRKDGTEDILNFLKNRITRHFSLDPPAIVFPLCSQLSKPSNHEHYNGQFKRFERELLEFTRTEKLFVILGLITSTLDRVVKAILGHTEDQKSLLEKDDEKIKLIRIEDPVEFINNERHIEKKNIQKNIRSMKKKLLDEIRRSSSETRNHLKDQINIIEDFKQGAQDLIQGANDEFLSWKNQIIESLFDESKKRTLIHSTLEVISQFENRFLQYYEKLKRLEVDVKIDPVIDQSGIIMPDDLFVNLQNDLEVEIETAINDFGSDNLLDWLCRFFGLGTRKIKQEIFTRLSKKLDKAHQEIETTIHREFMKITNGIFENTVDPVIKNYATEYVNVINGWIEANKTKREQIANELGALKKLTEFFKEKRREVSEITEDLDYLQQFTGRIRNGPLELDTRTWQDISTFLRLVKRYQYSNSIQYIFNDSIDSSILSPLHEYLWGCISILLQHQETSHFANFFTEMTRRNDLNAAQSVLGAVEHLAKFDFKSLAHTYRKVNFDDLDISIKKSLIEIASNHQRTDISRSVYCRHIRRLIQEVQKTYSTLIKGWEFV